MAACHQLTLCRRCHAAAAAIGLTRASALRFLQAAGARWRSRTCRWGRSSSAWIWRPSSPSGACAGRAYGWWVAGRVAARACWLGRLGRCCCVDLRARLLPSPSSSQRRQDAAGRHHHPKVPAGDPQGGRRRADGRGAARRWVAGRLGRLGPTGRLGRACPGKPSAHLQTPACARCPCCAGAPNVGGAWASEAYSQAWLVLESLRMATDMLAPKGTFVTKVFR